MTPDIPHDDHVRPGNAPPLVIDGITVGPPVTEGQARGLAAAGWLADQPDTLTQAWHEIERTWAATVERAQADHGDRLSVRVNGEWSFLETLRHLLFVTDAWIGIGVLGRNEHHPLGLPPHFIPNGRDLGLDLEAAPTLDEVLAVRAEKQAMVRHALRSLTAAELANPCTGRLSAFPVLGAFQVLMTEEGAHHRFASRDLASLTDS